MDLALSGSHETIPRLSRWRQLGTKLLTSNSSWMRAAGQSNAAEGGARAAKAAAPTRAARAAKSAAARATAAAADAKTPDSGRGPQVNSRTLRRMESTFPYPKLRIMAKKGWNLQPKGLFTPPFAHDCLTPFAHDGGAPQFGKLHTGMQGLECN